MDNIVPLATKRRRIRSSDIIDAAVGRDQPLPLEVLLDNLAFWHGETHRLEASKNPNDAPLARIARQQLQRAAIEAAPYCHAKLAQQTIAADPEQPLTIQHRHHISSDALRGKSVTELGAIWLALSKGDHEQLAELCPPLLDDKEAVE